MRRCPAAAALGPVGHGAAHAGPPGAGHGPDEVRAAAVESGSDSDVDVVDAESRADDDSDEDVVMLGAQVPARPGVPVVVEHSADLVKLKAMAERRADLLACEDLWRHAKLATFKFGVDKEGQPCVVFVCYCVWKHRKRGVRFLRKNKYTVQIRNHLNTTSCRASVYAKLCRLDKHFRPRISQRTT